MAERVANTDFTNVDRSADAEHFVRHSLTERVGAEAGRGTAGCGPA
jgi:hypothetical protein